MQKLLNNKFVPVSRFFIGWIKYSLKKVLFNRGFKINSSEAQGYAEIIRNKGYVVIENFISEDDCFGLIKQIDSLFDSNNPDLSVWHDEDGADKRIFNIEKIGGQFYAYHASKFIKDIAEHYYHGKMQCVTTMAAKIFSKTNNKGSGGGWHYDARYFEFKSLLYLTDVDINNGPFQIIEKSHLISKKLKHMFTLDNDGISLRISDNDVEKIVHLDRDLYKPLLAKAGTLVLVDTSSIHTGMKIKEGVRYSLFNYYYPEHDDLDRRRDQYSNLSYK